MNNFDFLKKEAQFSTFTDIAIAAEQIYQINLNICVSTCRQDKFSEIVGLNMNAAKEAFSDYLNDSNMKPQQIYFVNQELNILFKKVC